MMEWTRRCTTRTTTAQHVLVRLFSSSLCLLSSDFSDVFFFLFSSSFFVSLLFPSFFPRIFSPPPPPLLLPPKVATLHCSRPLCVRLVAREDTTPRAKAPPARHAQSEEQATACWARSSASTALQVVMPIKRSRSSARRVPVEGTFPLHPLPRIVTRRTIAWHAHQDRMLVAAATVLAPYAPLVSSPPLHRPLNAHLAQPARTARWRDAPLAPSVLLAGMRSVESVRLIPLDVADVRPVRSVLRRAPRQSCSARHAEKASTACLLARQSAPSAPLA